MKIGLIGYGYWGGGFVARNIARVADLAVIVDPDPNRIVQAAEDWAGWGTRFSTEPVAAFDSCDAVWIATPAVTHGDLVRQALYAGCHVMCEKPFVLSGYEANHLCDKADKEGLALMVGHLSLFTEQHKMLMSPQRLTMSSHVSFDVQRLTERASLSDHSVLWGLGPHDIASLVDLLGEPTTSHWRGNEHRVIGDLGWDESMTSAKIELDWLSYQKKKRFSYEVDGQSHDLANLQERGEPLLLEAEAFVALCSEYSPSERHRQIYLASTVTAVLEGAYNQVREMVTI